MSQNNKEKIVKYRKPLNLNIGMIIFAVILIYIIICTFMYFTQKHIEGHQVKAGSLSTNNIYQGIALRKEEIVSADQTGYINYYAREGERVGVGNLVYTLDESGKLADYLNTSESGSALSGQDLSELKTEILGFVNSFQSDDFTSVYDFKYDVQGTVLKLANANILKNIENINQSGISELISFCKAPDTGIVIYSVDGYEDLALEQFTNELYDTKNYQKTQLISNELIAAGDPVYKLSTEEDWSIVISTDKEKADELVKNLSLGGSITAATVCLNAATVCEAFDRPREALERYSEAKSIYEDFLPPGDARLGGLYNNMALACVSLKEYDQARELYQKAIEIMSALPGGKPETAITYLNLANAAEAQQGLENASEFITDCLQKAENLLLDESNALDGNYAFVCEKCAPTFEYYGWFMTAKEIKRRSDEIYERA